MFAYSKSSAHASDITHSTLGVTETLKDVVNVIAKRSQQALGASHLTTGWTEADLAFVSRSPLSCFDPLIMLLDRPAGMRPKAGIWPRDSGRTSSGCALFMVSRAVCVKLR